VTPPQLRQVVVLQRRQLDPVDLDAAGARLVEAGEDVHERRLARAGRAHDRGQMAAGDRERDTSEGVDCGLAGAVAAAEVAGDDDARRLGLLLVSERECCFHDV
jgi:hypothetical protein